MKNVIGITGTIASGKDYVGDYISDKVHAPVFQMSQPIIDAALKEGEPKTREAITEFAPKFAKRVGADYCARVHLATIEDYGIMTGIRQIAQIQYLKRNSNLVLLSVNAAPKTRFDRAQSRNKFLEARTFEQFVEDEQSENSGHHIQRVFDCMDQADYAIQNNETPAELHDKIDFFLRKFAPNFLQRATITST